MTVPLFSVPDVGDRRSWINSYLAVQSNTDRRIRAALGTAAADVEQRLLRLDDRNISSRAQRHQLALIKREIRTLISALFGKQVGPYIAVGMLDAVEAAAKAQMADERPFLRAIYPDAVQRKAFEAAFTAKARRNIDTMLTRVAGYSYVPLSKRVYKTQRLVNGWVDRIVNLGLSRGASAKEIAAQVKSSINPRTPGGASYAAMRLARTEINNAFHAQSVAQSNDSPFVEYVEWHRSNHPATHLQPIHLCDTYADIRSFSKEAVPLKPHPNCRCYIVPAMVSWAEFSANYQAGLYGTDRRVA